MICYPECTDLFENDLAAKVAQKGARHELAQLPQLSRSQSIEKLRKAGLNSQEITQLCQLRRNYQPDAQDRVPVDHTRLNFVRWLVSHGKLSEENEYNL